MLNFDSNTFYFIASTLFAVLFFFLGVYYNKKLLNRMELSFVLNEWLPIITTVKDIQFLQLINYVPPQNTNVYYLKAAIANTGNIDIDNLNIHKAMNIRFPDGYTIVREAHYSNNDLEIDSNYKKNEINATWNLFKPTEIIYFELILETNEIVTQTELEKKIKINHRISNLKKIKIFSVYPHSLKEYDKMIKTSNFLLIGTVVTLVLWVYLIFINKARVASGIKIPLKRLKIESAETFYRINDSMVKFTSDSHNYIVKLKDISKVFIVKPDNHNSQYLGALFAMGFLFVLILLSNLYYRKSRKRALIINNIS